MDDKPPETALAIRGEIVDATVCHWTDEQPAPWERQPGESIMAYQAFQAYRDMGLPRSRARLAASLGVNESALTVPMAKNHWVDRVTAWDAYQQKLADEAHDLAMQEAALLWERRRFKSAGYKWDVSKKLASVVNRKLDSIDDPSQIDINELIKLATLMSVLMDSALATAEGGDDSFDPQCATYEELELYLKKWGVNVPRVKRSRGVSAMAAGHTGTGSRPPSTDVDGTDPAS
jgi:hypothetical protein